MASQLGAYKKGKVEYAENQLDGMYSNGNGDANSNAARIYGFADEDSDGMADIGVNAPFKILAGGNIGFDLDGQEVSYNNMQQPFLKDSKLALGILKDNETIYNKGTQGGEINPEMLKSYEAKLTNDLQNEDALKSVLYDFESELNTADIAKKVTDNIISLDDARIEVVSRLVNARKDVFADGKKEYDIEQAKVDAPKQTAAQIAASKKVTKKLELLGNGQQITAMTGSTLRTAKLAPWADKGNSEEMKGKVYWMTDDAGLPIEEKIDGKYHDKTFTRDEVIDKLNLYNK
jgi:hypothetical protein